MSEIEISAVTGTYNRLPHLKRLVQSVRSSVGGLSYEIILVDGGSTDGTLEWCRSQEDVVLIEQGELLGAIAAFNAGCFAARGNYVAILNDDVEVAGDTLKRARNYLHHYPYVGQVAFRNDVQGTGDKKRQALSKAFGFLYGQCALTPKWLGDYAGWWGDEGMKTYGGDTRLSLRLWELGYPTIHVEGCEIIDHVVEDDLRKINSDDPWNHARKTGTIHPDLRQFTKFWKGRLPEPGHIIPANHAASVVITKAAQGNLRTMRFKGMMAANHKMRHALIDILGELGPSKQINQAKLKAECGNDLVKFQAAATEELRKFRPDLVILQSQRENFVMPDTVWKWRARLPYTFIVNFDGDTHSPLQLFHFQIARAVHLQCVVSPTLFLPYLNHDAAVAYWPIGIEEDYMVERASNLDGPDVVFLGALYGHGIFPEAATRENAVKTLHNIAESGRISFLLKGNGWAKIGLQTEQSNEQHAENAKLYARSKMALSVSQQKDLWGYSSDRLYNICATGCPALVQRFAGMDAHGFVDGETCIGWSDFQEMVNKVAYYLKHDDEREAIGLAGQEMCLNRHTWRHRTDALFTMIESMACTMG